MKISRGVQQQTRSSRNRDQWIQSSLKSHWDREAKKEWKKKKWSLVKALMGHHQNDQYICYGSLRWREGKKQKTESKKQCWKLPKSGEGNRHPDPVIPNEVKWIAKKSLLQLIHIVTLSTVKEDLETAIGNIT